MIPARITTLAWTACAAIAGCTTMAVRATPWDDASRAADAVGHFDSHVTAGLPASFVVTQPVTRARRSSTADAGGTPATSTTRVEIDKRLNASVRFPGQAPGSMYTGSIDGRAAVMTRTGDRLDVVIANEHAVETLRFNAGIDRIDHAFLPAEETHGAEADPVEAAQPVDAERPQRQRRSAGEATQGPPDALDIYVFTHKDLDHYMTREQIHAGYLAWWIADATGVMPSVTINLHFLPFIDGVTTIPYSHARALEDWTITARRWAEGEDIPFDGWHKKKFVLLTLLRPTPGTSGVAWQGGNAAVASILGRYRVVAHELGHLLGAVHEDAEVLYRGGWWCESNMYPTASFFRSNCQVYSDANNRRLRAHLVEGAGSEATASNGPKILDR